jgi:hypothetical protein
MSIDRQPFIARCWQRIDIEHMDRGNRPPVGISGWTVAPRDARKRVATSSLLNSRCTERIS